MQNFAQTFGHKWAYVLVIFAIFMLGFAGGSYTHSPGHHLVHATDASQTANEHEHIEISEDLEISAGSLLHCGADISADVELDLSGRLANSNSLVDRLAKILRPYFPSHDPPPPRFLS